MPATGTRRSPVRSLLVPAVLVLGVAAIGFGPLGRGPDEASNQSTADTEATSDRAILLNVGFEDNTDERPVSENFLVETPRSAQW